MKKTLAIVLSVLMIVCMIPFGAFAAEKTYDTPLNSYAEYERYKVSNGDKAYIDSLSYDQLAGVLLDWVDRQIAESAADFDSFELYAYGSEISLELPEIKGIDDIMAYAEYLPELGGDFAKLNIEKFKSLSRKNGDINFIYGVIDFMAENSDLFGKVFAWEEGKVFDYGKVGEYILSLDETNPDNKKIIDFYNDYLIGNNIQEKFISKVAEELNYTVPTDESGKRTETFDEIISKGILNNVADFCKENGILSEEGIALLKEYDLRTTDIYTLIKNFVDLVQSDNSVKISTYYNFALDTSVRSILKSMLGFKAVAGNEVQNSEEVKAEFLSKYSDLALLFEISKGNVCFKASDGKYYAFEISSDEVLSVKELSWEQALDINFEPPVADILTGSNFDKVVKTYRPTSEDVTIKAYSSAKNQAYLNGTGLEFDGEQVSEEYAALMTAENEKALEGGFGLSVKQDEKVLTELKITFTQLEEFAEAEALKAAKQAVESIASSMSLDITVEAVDVNVGYKGWATDDEFIVEAYLENTTVTLGGAMASFAQSAANSAAAAAVGTIIDNPIATIVVDDLSGNLNIDDAKALFDFIDTDFDIDESIIDISKNYDEYNGVVGQVNHILVAFVNMLTTDNGSKMLDLTDGKNTNLTSNLQKICDKADGMLKAAKTVFDQQGFEDFIASSGVNDLFASSHGFNAAMVYNIDFSNVESLIVCGMEMIFDGIDDETPGIINDIHNAIEGLDSLDAISVALLDYVLGKAIPEINEKIGSELTVPAVTDASAVKDGDGKDVIMTKLVDLGLEAITWTMDVKLNEFVDSIIDKISTDIPDVSFAFGVVKSDNWEDTLKAMVDRAYELCDGIIIACDNDYTDTFDRISAVLCSVLPMGSLLSNCAGNGFSVDLKTVVNEYIFDEALNGNFDNLLGLFETAEKTEDVAYGVSVTKALINASQHVVDSIFPGTVVADNYADSITVQEEFTSCDNDIVIASNNMKSIAARKTHLVPAALDLLKESGLLPYFASCDHSAGTVVIDGKDATCTEDGITSSVVCSECGYIISKGEVINALGHSFNQWTVSKNATCTEKGEETRACTRCGEKEIRYTDMLSHTFGQWTVSVPAGCTTEGKEVRYCSCGKTEERTISAAGHTDADGDGVCDVCGENTVEENLGFFARIRAFFQRIIDWFKNLFK